MLLEIRGHEFVDKFKSYSVLQSLPVASRLSSTNPTPPPSSTARVIRRRTPAGRNFILLPLTPHHRRIYLKRFLACSSASEMLRPFAATRAARQELPPPPSSDVAAVVMGRVVTTGRYSSRNKLNGRAVKKGNPASRRLLDPWCRPWLPFAPRCLSFPARPRSYPRHGCPPVSRSAADNGRKGKRRGLHRQERHS